MILTAKLVAETADYHLFFLDCGGDRVVISFGPMSFRSSEAKPFWAVAAFRQLNVSAIGIVCKGDTWYPRSLLDLQEKIAAIASRFKQRICYGFSMGAYGALKYSKLVSATEVLALSPQFSIDPADHGGATPWYTAHFSKDLHTGMAIKAADLSGEIVLVHDPMCPEDVSGISRIKPLSSRVHEIRAWYAGHTSIALVAKAEILGYLLEIVARHRWAESQRLITSLRKWGPHRRAVILHTIARRRAHLLEPFMDKHWDTIEESRRILLQRHYPAIAHVLAARAGRSLSLIPKETREYLEGGTSLVPPA